MKSLGEMMVAIRNCTSIVRVVMGGCSSHSCCHTERLFPSDFVLLELASGSKLSSRIAMMDRQRRERELCWYKAIAFSLKTLHGASTHRQSRVMPPNRT